MSDDPLLDEMNLGQASEVRNVHVGRQRTSLRLRTSEWDSLELIARREGCDASRVVTEIDARRGDGSLAGALRLFMTAYFRELAHEGEAHDGRDPRALLQPTPAAAGDAGGFRNGDHPSGAEPAPATA